jgi:hypothetical protein
METERMRLMSFSCCGNRNSSGVCSVTQQHHYALPRHQALAQIMHRFEHLHIFFRYLLLSYTSA